MANARSEDRSPNVRERLDRHKKVVGAILIVVIGVGLVMIRREMSSAAADLEVGRNYYSDDDGKTWFAESAAKAAPFDHNGKQAYQAEVYHCADGKPFVAYLISYAPADKAALEAAGPKRFRYVLAELAGKQLVKKPGGKSWVALTPQTTREYQQITTPICPDGTSKNVVYETPSD